VPNKTVVGANNFANWDAQMVLAMKIGLNFRL
jgi:hypothetical protein